MLKIVRDSARVGVVVGVVFGSWNVFYSWLYPLADDTPAALLAFYGLMFSVWAAVAFLATRRSGSAVTGVAAGGAVACATFCVYSLIVMLRVNLFLEEMTGRPDWQNLMSQFRASGDESLRTFVNTVYVSGAALKIGVASVIGGLMGTIGATFGRLTDRAQASSPLGNQ